MAIYVDVSGKKKPVKVVSIESAIMESGKSREWMLRNISSGRVKAFKVEGIVWVPASEVKRLAKDKKEEVSRIDPEKFRRKGRQKTTI